MKIEGTTKELLEFINSIKVEQKTLKIKLDGKTVAEQLIPSKQLL